MPCLPLDIPPSLAQPRRMAASRGIGQWSASSWPSPPRSSRVESSSRGRQRRSAAGAPVGNGKDRLSMCDSESKAPSGKDDARAVHRQGGWVPTGRGERQVGSHEWGCVHGGMEGGGVEGVEGCAIEGGRAGVHPPRAPRPGARGYRCGASDFLPSKRGARGAAELRGVRRAFCLVTWSPLESSSELQMREAASSGS